MLRLVKYLLKKISIPGHGHVLVGDVAEEYDIIRSSEGRLKAMMWIWGQLVITIPSYIKYNIIWSLSMVKNTVTVTCRHMLRHKLFSFINILGLAVSLSIGLLVIKIITVMYSSDRFHENGDRIYRVNTTVMDPGQGVDELAAAPLPLGAALEGTPGIESAVRIKGQFNGAVTRSDIQLLISGYYTDPAFLNVFSFPLAKGDTESALVEPFSIVLTQPLSQKLFGNENPIGEMIAISGKGEFKVTGVFEDLSDLKSHFRFECLTGISTLKALENQTDGRPSLSNWRSVWPNYVYVLLKEGHHPESVNHLFPEITADHYRDDDLKWNFEIQPLHKISPGRSYANELSMPIPPYMIVIFMVIVVVITLIAVFNYTHLSLAKALSRAKEVGIRKIVGANKHRVFSQFIGESVLISLMALGLGYILLQFLEPWFYDLNPEMRIHLYSSHFSPWLWIWFLCFAAALGVFAGWVPAMTMSRFNASDVLKDISKVKVFSRFTLRKVLMFIQIFISFLFVMTTLVNHKQIEYEKAFDLGFRADNILNVKLQDAEYNTFRQEIMGHSAIRNVSASAFLPGTGVSRRKDIKNPQTGEMVLVGQFPVDAHFIRNMELEVIAGRDFLETPPTQRPDCIIVNESAVNFFGFSSPVEALDQTITLTEDGSQTGRIIGVVRDFISQNVRAPIYPLMIRIDPKLLRIVQIQFEKERLDEVIQHIKSVWKDLAPDQPIQMTLFKRELHDYFAASESPLQALGLLSIISCMIAFMGLFGMVIYDTESRFKEIGVRKVLGARFNDVVKTLSKQFMILLLAGTVFAAPVAWYANTKILQSMTHHINVDFPLFAIGFAIMLGIGFTIILSYTYRAARSNPVDSLRSE